MNNTGKIPALAVRLIAALMTLYLYFNPTGWLMRSIRWE